MTNFYPKSRPVLITYIILFVLSFFSLFNCSKQVKINTANNKIKWLNNITEAKNLSKETGKPIMIEFMAEWCPSCQKMKDSTFTNSDVIKTAKSFIPVKIDVDKQRDIADEFNSNANKYGGIGIPNVLFIDHKGNEIDHPIGYKNPKEFILILTSVLSKTESK